MELDDIIMNLPIMTLVFLRISLSVYSLYLYHLSCYYFQRERLKKRNSNCSLLRKRTTTSWLFKNSK